MSFKRYNIGIGNQGMFNIGNDNFGDGNVGNRNIGFGNIGDDNVGDFNIGTSLTGTGITVWTQGNQVFTTTQVPPPVSRDPMGHPVFTTFPTLTSHQPSATLTSVSPVTPTFIPPATRAENSSTNTSQILLATLIPLVLLLLLVLFCCLRRRKSKSKQNASPDATMHNLSRNSLNTGSAGSLPYQNTGYTGAYQNANPYQNGYSQNTNPSYQDGYSQNANPSYQNGYSQNANPSYQNAALVGAGAASASYQGRSRQDGPMYQTEPILNRSMVASPNVMSPPPQDDLKPIAVPLLATAALAAHASNKQDRNQDIESPQDAVSRSPASPYPIVTTAAPSSPESQSPYPIATTLSPGSQSPHDATLSPAPSSPVRPAPLPAYGVIGTPAGLDDDSVVSVSDIDPAPVELRQMASLSSIGEAPVYASLLKYQSNENMDSHLDDDVNLSAYHPPAPTSHVVTVPYVPVRPDEMNMQAGDLIGIEKEFNDGWARGQNISQGRKRCLFPMVLVTPITSGPSQRVIRGQSRWVSQEETKAVHARIPIRTLSLSKSSEFK